MSHSQNNEEEVILDYFKGKVGKFIDIGAFHVTALSNTRALYENGWSGVLVEADPMNYKPIEEHYNHEPRITVLNTAIGISDEDLVFYSSGGDAVSTSDLSHKKKWEGGGVKFNKITVPQMHIESFLEQHGKGTNFISIDTEATNMAIFNAIPDWFLDQVELFCIEHDNATEIIIDRLSRHGLTKIFTVNAENIIIGR